MMATKSGDSVDIELKTPANIFKFTNEDIFTEEIRSNDVSSLFTGAIDGIFTKKKPITIDEIVGKRSNENIKGELSNKFPKKLKKKHALSVADTLISVFVIGPMVIGCWRGIWNLMDFHNFLPSGWLCFFIGTSLHCIFALLREIFHEQFVETWRVSNSYGKFGYGIVRIMYTWTFCAACNMQWRGGWNFLTEVMGSSTWTVLGITCTFIGILLIFRCSRNLLAPPFIIVVDKPNQVFKFPTRFKVNTRHWALYVLDCAFSVGIVGTLVVFVWRGVFVLLDLHLFPGNRQHSAIGSVIIGYVIVAITFCLQPLMRYACERMQGFSRLVVADAFLLMSFLGTVNVWRGIWALFDLWLIPENVELSCWITHVGCFVFLGLLNCSNSILVRGVYIDAEEEEGRCVVFPCHYLRLFFKIEREKKEARRRNLVTTSRNFSHSEGNGKDAENGILLNRTTLPTIIPANPGNLVYKEEE